MIQQQGKDLSYHLKQLKRFRFKPENIILGIGRDLSQLYLIDFGMSKVFRDIKHISFKDQQFFLGTKKYASIAAHLGQDVNDLESLMYILLYFLKQQLSSQNMVNVTDDERTKKVGEMNISMECEVSKDQPSQLQRIFEQTSNYTFKLLKKTLINKEEPNYNKLLLIQLQKSKYNQPLKEDNHYHDFNYVEINENYKTDSCLDNKYHKIKLEIFYVSLFFYQIRNFIPKQIKLK
ncbi:unnamed protein product [Paramecium sonneborni]|uniref:Protein kinase domain-containing protein n=1 Tax=Paramecium sonneborni TaxID=65129 RepID=A0A8S1LMG8_9CILI|nr:unnamed protein product [Paramecium sonneborni]